MLGLQVWGGVYDMHEVRVRVLGLQVLAEATLARACDSGFGVRVDLIDECVAFYQKRKLE